MHRHLRGIAMRFDDLKSETLNLRVSPSFKLALKAAADAERRSMVNMLEVLLGDHCERTAINPRDTTAPASPVRRQPRRVAAKAAA